MKDQPFGYAGSLYDLIYGRFLVPVLSEYRKRRVYDAVLLFRREIKKFFVQTDPPN
jgi:hypothetical protein